MNVKIDKDLENILHRVEKPARYIGGETNIIRKDPDDVDLRFGFAFPDTYEIGMSYMGLQILYDILNNEEDVYCERLFAPAPDMEEIMRSEGRKLFTLETFTNADELDIIGFTLQYEMSFTNVLNMLDLSGIPVRKDDRRGEHPMIIAGGPCAFNPEPLADFVDVFLIGDGEELLPKICIEYISYKKELVDADRYDSEERLKFLKKIAKIDGVYVPELYDAKYDDDVSDDGILIELDPLYDEAPAKIRRAMVHDIDKIAFPKDPLVPLIDTVHDRSVVETFRGCTRGCRFCQAGMIYRPVRERTPDSVISIAMKQLANTGHDELSLLSLSTSDHSGFEPMATSLMGLCKGQNVALSLPSLRLDSFSFKVLNEIQGYRKSGLTFAPEAGTQRLRDVINKNITENDIYSATRQAIELGWESIKLYFMIGLPTETYEDLDGIAEIAKNIVDINYEIRGRKGGRFRVTVSVSNFVPKAHTPFQWVAQDTPEEFIRKHDYLSNKLRIKGVTFNYHESNTSRIEAVFARGDRRCGRAIEAAWRKGCKFDAWSEHFDEDKWMEAFRETGTDPDFYAARKRNIEELLPWDHIDPFVSRKFLEDEYAKAIDSVVTPDCRQVCNGCGVNEKTQCFVGCNSKNSDIVTSEAQNEMNCDNDIVKCNDNGNVQSSRSKYIIEFSKTGTICYTSHLDLMRIFKRAFKRAGISLVHSQGFNPHPKMGFAQPLSLGYWSIAEYIEFEVSDIDRSDIDLKESDDAKDDSAYILEKLSEVLPEGVGLTRCFRADELKKTLASHTIAAEYVIEIPVNKEFTESHPDPGEEFMSIQRIMALKKQKKTKELKEIDIKPMIRKLDVAFGEGKLFIDTVLDSGSSSNLSPELVITSFIGRFSLETDRSDVKIMRKQIFFDEDAQKLIN